MRSIRHPRAYIILLLGLFGALLLSNTTAAQNQTGDPWKMLILVYRHTDTDYVDLDGQTKHLTASMSVSDAEKMVDSFLNLPHGGNVYEYSANLAEMEAYVQYVDRPLTELAPIGTGFWPSPDITRPELDEYAPPGLYDSVIAFWQASDPNTGQSIPSAGWGLGYWPGDYANGMTYATVFNISWVWTNDVCEGEVFLHEWLHGVTGFYMWLGFPFPVEDLHGAEEAGYTTDGNGCWKPWLIDYMQGNVWENGQYKGVSAAAWHTGSITTYDIQNWRAEYYNNETLSGLPVVVRDDAEINFHWGGESPHPLINVDHFSSRWTRDVYFSGGHYLFNIYRDDGLRIYIDGTQVFNIWEHGAEWNYRDIAITPGWHTVTVEQYEIDGWAGATVNWMLLPGDHETEGNNSPGFADSFSGTVVHGAIDSAGDVDYYWFTGQAGQQLTATITARLWGSELDSFLTLFDSDGSTVLQTNDDYYDFDSQLEATLPHDGVFYLAVRHYSPNFGGPGYIYTLDIDLTGGGDTGSIYISPSNNKTIGGIKTTSSDILRYEKATNSWTLVYDGSALGTKKNVSAFHIMDDGSLLLVFSGNQNIAGLGKATPYDVVKFTPNNPNSFPLGAGTFSWFFQGKQHDLSKGPEKIDALDYVGDRLLLSTTGTANVTLWNGTALKPTKEDVFVFDRSTNQWESALVIDGSNIPELKGKNLSSIWEDSNTGAYYATYTGSFKINGVKGNAKSIVKLTPNGSSYTPSFVDWLAPGVKFPSNLDGLDMRQ